MTTLSSPGAIAGVDAPFNNRNQVARLVGVRKKLSRADFDAAITAERLRISGGGSGIYTDKEEFQVLDEPGYRCWYIGVGGTNALNAINSHARNIYLGSGTVVLLGSNSSVALSNSGLPANAVGVDGDLSVDWVGGRYYVKGAGAWLQAGTVGGSSSAVSSLPVLTPFNPVLDLTGNKYSANQTLSGNISLSVGGVLEGAQYRVTFIPNGSAIVSLGGGLTLAAGSAAYSQTNRMTLMVEVIDGVTQTAWFVGAALVGGTTTGAVPAQVTGLRVTPTLTRGGTIPFDWTAVTGASTYIVERQLPDNSYQVHSIITDNFVRFERLLAGETHGARITAQNATGQGLPSVTVSGVVPTVMAAGFFDDFNVPDTLSYNPYPYTEFNVLGGGVSPWGVKNGELYNPAAPDTAPRKQVNLGRKNTTLTITVKNIQAAEGEGIEMRASAGHNLTLSFANDRATISQTVNNVTADLVVAPAGSTPAGPGTHVFEVDLNENAGTWRINGVVMTPFAINPAVSGTVFNICKYRSGATGSSFDNFGLT